jgi:hypothetical protein
VSIRRASRGSCVRCGLNPRLSPGSRSYMRSARCTREPRVGARLRVPPACGGSEQIRDGIQALLLCVLRSRCPVFPNDPRICAIRE